MGSEVNTHVKNDAIKNFVINLVLNGLIAYFLNRSKNMLHLEGGHGFGVDIVITTFALYLLLTWILIPVTKMHVRKGKAPKLNWDPNMRLHRILSKFPKSAFANALIFSILGLLFVAPLTLGLFYVVGITEMSPLWYSVFKGIWAGAIAGALVFLIVPIGLSHA